MSRAIFGTAQLFALTGPEEAHTLLRAAHECGFRAFDTAPSYGHGRSEIALADMLAGRRDGAFVTSKVGIAPTAASGRAVRGAKAVARRLPAGVQRRLRGGDAPAGHGRFGVDEVRASVEASLHRLGRLDRLMLHEVTPDDITDELLGALAGYVDGGDVGQLGVATANERTAACVARAPGLLRAVHTALGRLEAPVQLPDAVTTRVGHGALGPGGRDLRAVQAALDTDPELGARWRAVTAGTPWATDVATALIAGAACRPAAGGPLDALIVSTTRATRLPGLLAAASGDTTVPADVLAVLDDAGGG